MVEGVAALAGRAALITGASRGLGLEIVRAYAGAGASVFLCSRRLTDLDTVVAQLRAEYPGSEIDAAPADVGSESDVARVVEMAVKRFPDLDILVNNAAMQGPLGLLEDVDWQRWMETIRVNLNGSALTIRCLLPHLKSRGRGKIIQLSGGGAANPRARVGAYAVSKAAVVRLIETVAEECRGYGIDANCLAPGAMNTAMLEELLQAGPQAAGAEVYAKALKQKETGGAGLAQGAALAVFLASARSDGITGRLISAQWDRWRDWPSHIDKLRESDAYTLRRITGRDRAMPWGDV